MATPAEPARPKTAAELTRWLERDVSTHLQEETEAVAHGGTALMLLGIKGSTKDVDFAFRTQEAFDRFVDALKSLGFQTTADFRPIPGEVFRRLENPASTVDVVDARFPTWNNWRLTKAMLSKAVVLRLGNVRLVRPDRDAVFLFKTYPLRETDLDDLRTILAVDPPDEARVIALFDEQDAIHRAELTSEHVSLESLFLLLDLRFRFAASTHLLGPKMRSKIPLLVRHAAAKFGELDLKPTVPDLLARLRERSQLMDWDEVLGAGAERLRRRLAAGGGKPARHGVMGR